MTSPTVGLSEDDIKPAFLMLASCHNELAKQAKATDSKESDLHFHKAKRCLQKVYGTNTLSLETGSSTAPFRDYVTNSSNLPTGHKLAGDHASAQNLQREVQSLRDRQIHHSACLSQLRSTKRKIEEDLDTERHCRRKVERDLEYASRELAASRRAERFAVEQCKREAEARRRGEDRALELRDKMVAMDKEFDALAREISEKERKKRECFGELGVFFLKVAEGEIRFESENLAQVGVSPH